MKKTEQESCPSRNQIVVLHTTPKEWIPNILKKGFELPKDNLSRVSFGRGSAEDDILFFEKFTPRGARYILSWKYSLGSNRNKDNGILKATVCSKKHLSKKELTLNRKELSDKGTKFILKNLGESESKRLYDHLQGRLETDDTYDDPLSFLRKIANDSDHCIYNDQKKCERVVRYGMGEVLEALGYDSADGFTGSHGFSPIKEDRKAPINEIVVGNMKNISNISEIKPEELCNQFEIGDELMHNACEKLVRNKK